MTTDNDDEIETPMTRDEIETAFYRLGDPDFSNSDRMLDSRDIIARLEEVEELFEECGYDISLAKGQDFPDGLDGDTDPGIVIQVWEDYYKLKTFADEAADYAPDWLHSASLIRDDHFTEYAKELTEDLGGEVPSWVVVDWDATAEAIKIDYTEVTWDGQAYWIR